MTDQRSRELARRSFHRQTASDTERKETHPVEINRWSFEHGCHVCVKCDRPIAEHDTPTPDPAARIVSRPGVMSGAPCIRGTRIPVAAIQSLAERGYSVERINRVYPQVSREDIEAAIDYPTPDPAAAGEREARCESRLREMRCEQQGGHDGEHSFYHRELKWTTYWGDDAADKPDNVAVPRETLERLQNAASMTLASPEEKLRWIREQVDALLGRGRCPCSTLTVNPLDRRCSSGWSRWRSCSLWRPRRWLHIS